ncbi:hypothetical protein B0H19DRAFT_1235329 [Mycena capillaripes]|nr:hypothetical protein B0H19DRAFT_1235329 [Mycena capillaripes]
MNADPTNAVRCPPWSGSGARGASSGRPHKTQIWIFVSSAACKRVPNESEVARPVAVVKDSASVDVARTVPDPLNLLQAQMQCCFLRVVRVIVRVNASGEWRLMSSGHNFRFQIESPAGPAESENRKMSAMTERSGGGAHTDYQLIRPNTTSCSKRSQDPPPLRSGSLESRAQIMRPFCSGTGNGEDIIHDTRKDEDRELLESGRCWRKAVHAFGVIHEGIWDLAGGEILMKK